MSGNAGVFRPYYPARYDSRGQDPGLSGKDTLIALFPRNGRNLSWNEHDFNAPIPRLSLFGFIGSDGMVFAVTSGGQQGGIDAGLLL